MKLKQIPGTEVWVNPEYVTSVRKYVDTKNPSMKNVRSEVEYEGNAGYRTRSAHSTATPEELKAIFES